MIIKILSIDGKTCGVEVNRDGAIPDEGSYKLYVGNFLLGDIVKAMIVTQAAYPTNQWMTLPQISVSTTDRITRQVYRDKR